MDDLSPPRIPGRALQEDPKDEAVRGLRQELLGKALLLVLEGRRGEPPESVSHFRKSGHVGLREGGGPSPVLPPFSCRFAYKVTVEVEAASRTIIESFGDLKPRKKAAQDHAAEGALWCMKNMGFLT